MIVDIPISYRARVRLGQRRKLEPKTLLDTVSVSLAEVPGAQAPVALWWPAPGLPRGVLAAVRCHEGVLYEALYQDPDDEERGLDLARPVAPFEAYRALPEAAGARLPVLVGGEGLAASLAGGACQVRGLRISNDAIRSEGERLADLPVRQVEDSELEAVRARWAANAAVFLVVDGVAHRRVGFPLIEIESRFGEAVMKPVRADGYIASAAATCRADRYEEALSRWRDAWRALGGWRPGMEHEHDYIGQYGFLPPCEVVRPDLLLFDEHRFQAGHCAAAIVGHLSGGGHGRTRYGYGSPLVLAYPRDVVMAYGHLRDALKAEAPLDALLDRLEDFAAAARPHGTLDDLCGAARVIVERARREVADDAALLDAFGGPP